MSVDTLAVRFSCEGDGLVGIVERPSPARRRGVLIIVGGPQYRVGSHRQFVLLARDLAAQGFPVFRFDYRGMGDSSGPFRGFEAIRADIAAALTAFVESVPGLGEVVLWGLCDGASAAAFYAASDARVAGLVLVNPWIRTEQGLARSYVSHYYGRRLLQPGFWRQLLSGRMNVAKAARDFAADLARAGGRAKDSPATTDSSLPARVLGAVSAFRGPVLFLLSGRDLTAREFADQLDGPGWAAVLARPDVQRLDLPGADHTFSQRSALGAASEACANWLKSW